MRYQGQSGVITGDRPERLLDAVRRTLRTLHYSLRTERAYIEWI